MTENIIDRQQELMLRGLLQIEDETEESQPHSDAYDAFLETHGRTVKP